jgi:hypothetical protein
MMQEVKMNKNYSGIYKSYLNSNKSELYQCYDNYSEYKEDAMNYCKKLCNDYKGYDFKIISYNCMQFSVGFRCLIDDVENFVYITKSYDRIMKIEE